MSKILKKPKNILLINNSGMTLIELVLYVAIFATLFAGFITYVFEFSRTIATYSKREDAERVGAIAAEFVRWHVHRSEQSAVPNVADALHLFRFDTYIKPREMYFIRETCGKDAEYSYPCVRVYFQLQTSADASGTAGSITELLKQEVPIL